MPGFGITPTRPISLPRRWPAPSWETSLPPEPRLEQINRLEKDKVSNTFAREKEKEDFLHSYGQTPEKGYVHVPIERAMDLLAGKLPARKEQPKDKQSLRENGLLDGGAPNSGQMFRGNIE